MLGATHQLYQNNKHAKDTLNTIWGVLQKDMFIITDKYNKHNHHTFRDNRHDQSIFSVVKKLMGTVIIPDYSYPPGNTTFPFWSSRLRP